MMRSTAGTLTSSGHAQALLFRPGPCRTSARREPSPCAETAARPLPRLLYEQCEAGLRIVHETHGPGVIVRTSAQLVHIRLDGRDYNTLAFAAQLRREALQRRI